MKSMRYTAFLVVAMLFHCLTVNAQWVQLPCTEVTPQLTASPIAVVGGYNCIEAPKNGSMITIDASHTLDYVAEKYIHIKEGFSVERKNGFNQFHVYLRDNDYDIVQYYPLATPGQVDQFDLLELGFSFGDSINQLFQDFINGDGGLNPFDTADIDITTTVTAPDGSQRYIYGFYYEPYVRGNSNWTKDTTSHNFRLRFAPDQVGHYKFDVAVTIDANTTLYANPFVIESLESSNDGFVLFEDGVGDGKYFHFLGSGKTFFPVGENMAWSTENNLTPSNMQQLHHWMQQLASEKGNFIRLGMTPGFLGLEWEELGNYATVVPAGGVGPAHSRMAKAWEMDNTVNIAKDLGIYINLTMDWHDIYTTGQWPASWNDNPYKTLPSVFEPIDVFRDGSTREYYKRRFRYIEARWGYSTQIVAYDFMNEVDNALTDYNDNNNSQSRGVFNNWMEDMKSYLREWIREPYHLVTVSLGEGEGNQIQNKAFTVAEAPVIHQYGRELEENYGRRWRKTRRLRNHNVTQDKPIMYQEFGMNTNPLGDACNPIQFHNSIWSTALSGNAGCAQVWWWDNAIHQQGYFFEFRPLAVFFENEQMHNLEWDVKRWTDGFFMPWDAFWFSDYEAYYLREGQDRVLGFVHNLSQFWANYYDTDPCLQNLMDNDSEYAYSTYYKRQPQSLSGDKIRITGLRSSGIFNQRNYRIEWYNTNYPGGHVPMYDASDNASFTGVCRFTIPPTNSTHTDWAFKIYYNGTRSLTQNQEGESIQIEEQEQKVTYILYPNPNNGQFTLKVDGKLENELTIEVYDIMGKLVFFKEHIVNVSTLINLTENKSGMYLVRIVDGDLITTKKVILK